MIENFERFLNERYPGDRMNRQPYVVMEINNKVTRDIADKHKLDQEVVRMIIQEQHQILIYLRKLKGILPFLNNLRLSLLL